MRVLKRLGYRIAVISGGFSRAAEALKRRLGVDYAYSNNLEVQGGKLTGRVVGPIVNAQRKAELLETIAQAEGVLLDQVIAVGDGANDALMLERAGLGIAFHAKPKLRESRRHQHLRRRARRDPVPARDLRRESCKRWIRSCGRTRGAGAVGDAGLAVAGLARPPAAGRRRTAHGVHLSWVRGEAAAELSRRGDGRDAGRRPTGRQPLRARRPPSSSRRSSTRQAGRLAGRASRCAGRWPADRQPVARQHVQRLQHARDRRRADDRHPDRSRGAAALGPRRTATPARAAAGAAGPAGRATLLALGGWGQLPRPAAGAGLAATVDIALARSRAGDGGVLSRSGVRHRPTTGLASAWRRPGDRLLRPGRRPEQPRWPLGAVRRSCRPTCCTRSSTARQPANPGQRWYVGLAQSDAPRHRPIRPRAFWR